jgi:hypothetical protein
VSRRGSAEPQAEIIEERANSTGDIVRRYVKGRFLGKGWSP